MIESNESFRQSAQRLLEVVHHHEKQQQSPQASRLGGTLQFVISKNAIAPSQIIDYNVALEITNHRKNRRVTEEG